MAVTGAFDNDEGTVSLTVNTTTKTVTYDASGLNGDGSVQAIATDLANLFNNDPNSPVTARVIQGPILPAGNGDNWQILLTTKTSGASVNYGVSGSVNSFLGNSPSLAVTSNFVLTGGSGSCC